MKKSGAKQVEMDITNKVTLKTLIHQNENLVFMRILEVNMALGMNQ